MIQKWNLKKRTAIFLLFKAIRRFSSMYTYFTGIARWLNICCFSDIKINNCSHWSVQPKPKSRFSNLVCMRKCWFNQSAFFLHPNWTSRRVSCAHIHITTYSTNETIDNDADFTIVEWLDVREQQQCMQNGMLFYLQSTRYSSVYDVHLNHIRCMHIGYWPFFFIVNDFFVCYLSSHSFFSTVICLYILLSPFSAFFGVS